MDQVRIGAFIAQLRKEKDWTQEELGERLGVTNKTVSRWENGNYMPSIEILTMMGREFGVSLNELIEGRRLGEDEFRTAADEKLAAALRSPVERLCRWLERYGAYAAAVFLLCCVIAGLCVGMVQYRQAHPADARVEGTWCTDPDGTSRTEEYAVLLDGKYYRYRQFEPLEYGSYTVDGPLATVTTAERSFNALVKGNCIYVPDEEGRLTAYKRDSDIGIFVNVHEEDFEE